MNAPVLTPKSYRTFDVEVDGKHLGSIWRYRDGWVAYDPQLRALRLIFDHVDDAIEALKERAG